MKFLLAALLLAFSSLPAQAASPLQRLQQMVDYIAVDYPGAVAQGQVLNQTEYEEMQDFAQTIGVLADQLPDSPARSTIRERIQQLQELIRQKSDASEIATLAADLRQLLTDHYRLPVVPSRPPDPDQAQQLFADQCAACHGAQGRGDGPLARALDPPPTDFTDAQRYRQRTLYGLYSTISLGVEGTAMKAYTGLTDDQRWSLAFLAGSLATDDAQRQAGRQQWLDTPELQARWSLQRLTTSTPAEIEAEDGPAGAAVMAWLRSQPGTLFSGANSGKALDLAREQLRAALSSYRAGDRQLAHRQAVTAYLEGFELTEGNLDAVNRELRLAIEQGMTDFRQGIKHGLAIEQLEALQQRLDRQLQQAAQLLTTTRLSPATAFASALVILLREGLEAILVIAALAAFLVKTGRREGLRYLGLGIAAALGLGALTWWASSMIEISGAGRELTEGLAALFAALMLFYVGFWMHSKTSAAQWRGFIQGSIEKALGQGALWGLSSLAFIAVYREIFESVLFYQALWLQTGEAGRGMILYGLMLALALLLVLGWLILRYSTRLPLRQFFAVTAVFMFVLAVVFAGKGVAALQEAGRLPVDLIRFPRIDLLGIYPTRESLGLQLAMILLALYLLWRSGRNINRNA